MINKKRLAMMALASTIVFPSSLSLTPILAADDLTSMTEEPEPTPLTGTDLLMSKIGTDNVLEAGNYTLDKDIDRTEKIIINGEATIDLNGYNISSSAQQTFSLKEGSTLEITGKGTITCSNNIGSMISVASDGVTITIGSEVELVAAEDAKEVYAISLGSPATNCTVNLNGTKINTELGININGKLTPEGAPTINLNKAEITANATGIYQAGFSTVNVTNSVITSATSSGIETRAGNLIVSGGSISGSKKDPLEVEANSNGTTTLNAGIAVAQHTTDRPINVTIKDNAKVEGYAALSIMDPQNQQKDITDEDPNITINVEKATLDGTVYDVAYTEDTIKFNLNGTTVNEDKIQKLYSQVVTDENGNTTKELVKKEDGSFVEEVKNKNNPAYQLTPPSSNTVSGGGGKKKPTKPVEPEEPTAPVATPTTMYRLYNKLTGEHLYTIDKNERDNLLTSDTWKDEGQGWIAPSVSDYPVYRLLNPNNGDHHYTTDKNEFDTLPTYGWVAEGLAFFSADKDNPENVILHRLYNPNAEGAGSHHYTADTNERDTLVAQGWKYEGTAWAGLPANK